MKGHCRLWAAAGMLLFLGMFMGTAGAATIYNNFNTGNGYDTGTGWTVAGSGTNASGMAFTPSGSFTLTQIDVAVNLVSGTNSVSLTLNSDSSGTPGGILETWGLSGLPAFGSCCTVETVTPVGSIVLDSGTQYWIVATAGATDTEAAWMFNTTSATGFKWQTTGGTAGDQTLGAFDVLGDAVPEPSSVLLTAGGLALLWFRRRR